MTKHSSRKIHNDWGLACPKCGNSYQLEVWALTEARIEGTDVFLSADYSFLRDNDVCCHTCKYIGPWADFETEDRDDE